MSTWKTTKIFLLTMAVGLVSMTSPSFGSARFAQGEFVVGLDSGADIDSIHSQFGTSVRHYLPLHDLYLLDAPAGVDLAQLCAEIAQLPYVAFSHPNYLVDPMRGVQSSLPFADEMGTKQDYLDQPAGQLLNIGAAHTISTGSEQLIGVIDGGVNMQHSAFDGRVFSGWDYVDNDADADEVLGGVNSGHGTFVAGVIHFTVPDATIRSYRVCDTDGEADGFVVAEAILQAVADGCGVINVSLSTTAVHQAIATACEYARGQDVVVVCAAGNDYRDIGHYPGSDPNTLSVAAIDSALTLADYSSYGEHITLVAPGTDIYSPFLNESYAWWSGTSFAAPFAAAEIAMIRSLSSSMTWDQAIKLLVGTAVNLDQFNQGHSGQLGAGVLNPYGAVLHFNGWCGDVSGDNSVGIQDVAVLIDGLFLSGEIPDSVGAAGLDGHDLITNNDLCAINMSIYTSLAPAYCNPILEAAFPPSADIIQIAMTEVPPLVDVWTVKLLARLTDPHRGLTVALEYDLPESDIMLIEIEHLRQPELGPFEVRIDSCRQVLIGEACIFENASAPLAGEIARLTFSLTPADTSRLIQFAPATIDFGDISHTTVISKADALEEHVEGWAPRVVSIPGHPGTDRYGHVCVGLKRGDVNLSSEDVVDIVDVSLLIDFLFGSGMADIAIGEADMAPKPHPDGILDISDLQTLVDHLFITMDPLPTCYD